MSVHFEWVNNWGDGWQSWFQFINLKFNFSIETDIAFLSLRMVIAGIGLNLYIHVGYDEL
jgi:hypothetical protein